MNTARSAPITNEKPLNIERIRQIGAFVGSECKLRPIATLLRLDKLARFTNSKSHPYIGRWRSIVARSKSKTSTRGSHIVCEEWDYPSETGFPNFLKWLIPELRKIEDLIIKDYFTIKRKDINLPWCPENCHVLPRSGISERIKDSQRRTRKVKISPAKKTKVSITPQPPRIRKERCAVSIDYVLTPVRIKSEDFELDRKAIIPLIEFIFDLRHDSKLEAKRCLINFTEGKVDEVYLLKNPEGETLLAMYFSRYDFLRTICIAGIFTTLSSNAAKSAILTALSLLEDELDYVSFFSLMIKMPMDQSLESILRNEGFKTHLLGNKIFLERE